MVSERSRATMTERIAALLSRADAPSTPAKEADLCREKALELLAKHGISESEARGAQHEGTNVIEKLTFHLRGQYLNQQKHLLGEIVDALHCEGISYGNSRSSEITAMIYGVKIHTGRVQLLFSILKPRMIAAALRLTAPPGHKGGTRGYRVDWMLGYASRIGERLAAAERAAATDRDTETGTTTQALVLVSDADRAKKAVERAHPKAKSGGYSRAVTPTAYDSGRAAGNRADLADRSQVGGRRAIG